MNAMFKDKKAMYMFFAFVVLFTLHITPATYTNSNFLSQFFDTRYIGLIYICASLATICIILGLRDKLRRFGNYRVLMGTLILETIAVGLLIFGQSIVIVCISIVTMFISASVYLICIDIFLEKHCRNDSTGRIRGLYLTSINAAYIIGPFISSFLLTNGDFKNVYLFIFILMFPIMFLTTELFKDFKDDPYDQIRIISGFRKIRNNLDVYSTLTSNVILQFFYGWMIMYLPIYLYQVKNFSLSEIALIISIALIPFVLIQGFAGKLADKYYGEKEMLTLGFIVLTCATAALSFITSPNISVWIAVLFMTRVGASMIEVMTETHLFKRIDGGDVSVISVLRILKPVAYVVGAILGTLFLQIVAFNMIFLVLAGITLYGLRYSLALTDSR
jgi:predicted MFS family arabinose efflux permease